MISLLEVMGVATVSTALLVGIALAGPEDRTAGERHAAEVVGASTSVPAPVTAESLGGVVQVNPFRLDRQPSPIPYDPVQPVASEQPAPPKPILGLTGILWSRTPVAILEGLPGQDGARLVRRGDRIGGLEVVGIGRTQVVVRGMDTTWYLRVREAWR